MKLVIASLVIGSLIGSVGGAADAQSAAAQADQLFKKGKRLLAQKKYPEACAAFEQSDRLDPGIGAKLNDLPLLSDGITVAKPTSLVEVVIDAIPATNTLFGLQLYDLLPSADGMRLDYHMVLDALGTDATFHLPPEVFVVGHTYTLRAICTAGGFPALGNGDLTARRLPMSQSYADSGVFTVMP